MPSYTPSSPHFVEDQNDLQIIVSHGLEPQYKLRQHKMMLAFQNIKVRKFRTVGQTLNSDKEVVSIWQNMFIQCLVNLRSKYIDMCKVMDSQNSQASQNYQNHSYYQTNTQPQQSQNHVELQLPPLQDESHGVNLLPPLPDVNSTQISPNYISNSSYCQTTTNCQISQHSDANVQLHMLPIDTNPPTSFQNCAISVNFDSIELSDANDQVTNMFSLDYDPNKVFEQSFGQFQIEPVQTQTQTHLLDWHENDVPDLNEFNLQSQIPHEMNLLKSPQSQIPQATHNDMEYSKYELNQVNQNHKQDSCQLTLDQLHKPNQPSQPSQPSQPNQPNQPSQQDLNSKDQNLNQDQENQPMSDNCLHFMGKVVPSHLYKDFNIELFSKIMIYVEFGETSPEIKTFDQFQQDARSFGIDHKQLKTIYNDLTSI